MTVNILFRQTSTPSVPVSTSVKGSPLTWEEHDGNFKSIQNELNGRQSWLIIINVTGTSVTAAAGNHYYLTNASATAVTLPPAPSNGDVVKITVSNGRTDNTILRNGNTIEDIADDYRLDNKYLSIELQYLNGSWRLV